MRARARVCTYNPSYLTRILKIVEILADESIPRICVIKFDDRISYVQISVIELNIFYVCVCVRIKFISYIMYN